ncbi:hypothetical protein IW262DRAFT_1462809 [Armillaria fumosa]|nr:hypothetical protein IW262DRAFT_1462809 [Armillaria fumosa]
MPTSSIQMMSRYSSSCEQPTTDIHLNNDDTAVFAYCIYIDLRGTFSPHDSFAFPVLLHHFSVVVVAPLVMSQLENACTHAIAILDRVNRYPNATNVFMIPAHMIRTSLNFLKAAGTLSLPPTAEHNHELSDSLQILLVSPTFVASWQCSIFPLSPTSLESPGLIALADLSTVAVRGMHQRQSTVKINDGELPETGSMTNGYVFRAENPATVSCLRHISRTGKLVTAEVSLNPTHSLSNRFCDLDLSPRNNPFFVSGIRATLLYLTCPIPTIVVFALLSAIRNWWAVVVLGMLVLARFINVVIIKRRREEEWKGGERVGDGDLLIVLSRDRLLVTGSDFGKSFVVGLATLLVNASAALAGNASTLVQLLDTVPADVRDSGDDAAPDICY